MNNYFSKIEWLLHTGVVYLFGLAAFLINSFIMIYIIRVDDVNYYAPLFSILLVVANLVYCIRISYRTLIFSAGHFKQTEKSSYIEAGINIIISLFLVNHFGLVGVAVGTLTAMLYQMIYLVCYLSKNVVFKPIKSFALHLIVDTITFSGMLLVGYLTTNFVEINNFIEWVILAMMFIVIIFIINIIFYKERMFSSIKTLLKRG